MTETVAAASKALDEVDAVDELSEVEGKLDYDELLYDDHGRPRDFQILLGQEMPATHATGVCQDRLSSVGSSSEPSSPAGLSEDGSSSEPTVIEESLEASLAHLERLPSLPLELHAAIILEASTVPLSPYQGDDLGALLARQSFLARACCVCSAWQEIAEPLLYAWPRVKLHTAARNHPASGRRGLAQELDWHPRLQLFLASLLESKERRYTDDSEVPIALNLRINHTPAPRAASEQPIRLVDAGAYRSGLLIHDDIKASGDKARLLGFSVEALTLDGNHDADLSEALRFVEYCDLRDLEQLHLRGRVGLEAVLDDIFTRWALWAPLKRFTDLRLQCVLTADVVDALEGALKEIGPQLRTFHLQPSDDAWIPRHLLDNLDRLELLALNTRSCAFLFDQGRLPRLKYLFLGQPKQRGSIMDPLLTARSRLLYKERIDDIFKHVATSGRRLHVGLWQLSFKLIEHRNSHLVQLARDRLKACGLTLVDRFAQELPPELDDSHEA